jgi:hypothetical protein
MDKKRNITDETERVRWWLAGILGPTAKVENYSPEYVWRRFRDMWGFYGSSIMEKWNAPPSTF